MKLPRDLSGRELVKALARLEYEVGHQSGSHIRLTTQRNGEHRITVLAPCVKRMSKRQVLDRV